MNRIRQPNILLNLSLMGAILGIIFCGCGEKKPSVSVDAIKPLIITEPTARDTDDPAIWLHPTDRSKSLIIGTDKDPDGALYVFDLAGRIIE